MTTWTGHLRVGDEPGTVVGHLTDQWGWTVAIEGKSLGKNKGYALTGTLGDVPEALRIPAVDGAA